MRKALRHLKLEMTLCELTRCAQRKIRVLGLVVAIRRPWKEINKGSKKALEEEVDALVLHKQNGVLRKRTLTNFKDR